MNQVIIAKDDIKYRVLYRAQFLTILDYLRNRLGINKYLLVDVLLVSSNRIKTLAIEHGRYTLDTCPATIDVLSYPLYDAHEIVSAPMEVVNIGQIIFAPHTICRNARRYNHKIVREWAYLFAHSTLHLLGYDHVTPEGEQFMNTICKEALTSLGIMRE